MLIICWAIATWIAGQTEGADVDANMPYFILLFDFVLFLTLVFALSGIFG